MLCWDVFDFLDRASATALAHGADAPAASRRGAAGDSSARRRAARRSTRSTSSSTIDNLRYRTYPASRPRQKRAAQSRHHQDVRGLRVTESFLMKNNVREILLRKPAYPRRARDSSRTPIGATQCAVCAPRPISARRDHYVGHDEGRRARASAPKRAGRHQRTTSHRRTSSAGALELAACVSLLPAGDSLSRGRRSRRRVTRVAASPPKPADYRFVAPDNGVLTAVFAEHAAHRGRRAHRAQVRARRLSAARSKAAIGSRRLQAGSRAARRSARWGRASTDWHDALAAAPQAAEGLVRGEVMRVDRFGNLITNITRATLEALVAAAGRGAGLDVARCRWSAPMPRWRPASCARSLAAPATSRLPSVTAAPPSGSRGGRGRTVTRVGSVRTIPGCHDEFRADRGTTPPRAEHPRVGRAGSRSDVSATSIANTASTRR